MFASDIGMNQIEEINIVRNGENYGWMRARGIWENGRGGVAARSTILFPLSTDKS
jgi:glucose/arabinose dehydrogenase